MSTMFTLATVYVYNTLYLLFFIVSNYLCKALGAGETVLVERGQAVGNRLDWRYTFMVIIEWRELALSSFFVDFSTPVLSTSLVLVRLCGMGWLELFSGVCGWCTMVFWILECFIFLLLSRSGSEVCMSNLSF